MYVTLNTHTVQARCGYNYNVHALKVNHDLLIMVELFNGEMNTMIMLKWLYEYNYVVDHVEVVVSIFE